MTGYVNIKTDIPEGLESEYEWNIKNEDLIPMVIVDDALYLDTGYEKEANKRPDTFEGVINSEVDRREKPIVKYMNDKWQVFATEKIIASRLSLMNNWQNRQGLTRCGIEYPW